MTARAIILAAGASSRMGEPKGLWRDGAGRTWLERQCAALVAAGLTHATLVLGADHARYKEALPALASDAPVVVDLPIVIVHNQAPERGPFSSLQLALHDDSVFVLPVDVPAAPAAVWDALRNGLRDHHVALPTHAGKGGHPVLLAAAWMDELRALSPEQARLDHSIHALPAERVVRVACDAPEVTLNLNTPEDRYRYSVNPA